MLKYAYLIYLATLSVFAFFLYAIDKRKAVRGAWRIKESALLGVSFVGGALGGLIAMYLVRHKTRKWYFVIVNCLGLAWQVAVAVFLFV